MAQEVIELRNLDAGASKESNLQQQLPDDNMDHEVPGVEFSLPPVDTGKQAWLFLAACWGVEAVTFGFGFSFGVFQDYYSAHKPFAGSGSIAAIGTTTMGILYLGTPFVVTVCRIYPRQARWFTLAGLFIASLALALSSFCTNVPQLIVTQGLIFGLGGCIAYCPCTLYIDEWFVQRKGLAYGIVWSAAGFGGAVLPLCIEALLHKVGFQKTTQICAGILFGIAAPLSFWVKPRLPYSANTHRKPLNMRFATTRLFILYQSANFIEAAGYFLPTIYLPLYARMTFGTSTFLSALTAILVNVAATIGLVIMGLLSDKLHVTTCMVISAAGVATSVLLIWGLSTSLPTLYAFCFMYGLFAGSWPAVWPGIMRQIAHGDGGAGSGQADPIMVQAHLAIGRGAGNVLSGPLSGLLIKDWPWQGSLVGGYGSGFGILILFTGITGLLSGTNFLLRHLSLL